MAQWQRELNLVDVWPKARSGEITYQELGRVVAARLRDLQQFHDMCLDLQSEDIADEFEDLPADARVDDFDVVLERLYDWADTSLDGQWNGRKVCWVRTS